MTQHATGRETHPGRQTPPQSIPAFKNLALPALAAAVQAAKRRQESRPQTPELPAILRKEAMQG